MMVGPIREYPGWEKKQMLSISKADLEEMLNIIRDLVGDFPEGIKSNALEGAKDFLKKREEEGLA